MTVPIERVDEYRWRIPPDAKPGMRVPAIIFADDKLMDQIRHDQSLEQAANSAMLPGIVKAAYAMPDIHQGYGLPIGAVVATHPDQGGVITPGGVGYDINCGVRLLRTELTKSEVLPRVKELVNGLFAAIPAGVGSHGRVHLTRENAEEPLLRGAAWAVEQGLGEPEDLVTAEASGCLPGADPGAVSRKAFERGRDQLGTLGSGNHYLEVQRVAEIYDEDIARAFGLSVDAIVVAIHCGSRGLGHQIGTDYLKLMVNEAPRHGIELPDRELASVPLKSDVGRRYLGAMRAGINCALANRQIVTEFARGAFRDVFGESTLSILYDVSHNTCKEETHWVDGEKKRLFVHRKGATRAFGPGHPELPDSIRDAGQPVLIGGSMGTSSYILAGTEKSMKLAFGSACHGAGRAMSRHEALKRWRGRQVIDDLAARGILIRSHSSRGVAEEAPGAYKDVTEVVNAADQAELARKVAKLLPLICVKG